MTESDRKPDSLSIITRALPRVLAIVAILALGYWCGATSRPGKRTTSDWWTDLPHSGVVIDNDSAEPRAVRMVFEGGEVFAASLEPHEEIVSDIRPEPETWLRIELSRDPSMLTNADAIPQFRGDYYLPASPDEGYLLRVRFRLIVDSPSLSVAGAVREVDGRRTRRVQSLGKWGVRVESNATDTTLSDVRFELGSEEVEVGELPPGAGYVWSPERSELQIQEARIWYTLNGREEERWSYPDSGPGLRFTPPKIWEFSIPHW